MNRNNLLESNYRFEPKEPKNSVVALLWIPLFIFILAAFVIVMVFNIKPDPEMETYEIIISYAVLVAMPVLYFYLKCKLTSFFCVDKDQSVNMRFVEDLAMPVCTCREALKTKQFLVINSIPIILVYIAMCLVNVLIEIGGAYIGLVFVMSIIMSFDMMLMVYILYLQKTYKFDYLAINKHVYNLTMYTKYTKSTNNHDFLKIKE